MKIQAQHIDKILSQPKNLKQYKHWIVFGSDVGYAFAVQNKVIAAYKKSLHYHFVRYDYGDIDASDGISFTNLKHSVSNKDLFGEITSLVIHNYPDQCTRLWSDFLQDKTFQGISIFLAGELKKANKLRRICEDLDHIAVVNCYKLDEEQMIVLVEERLQAMQLHYDSELPYFIVQNLIPSYPIVMQEIEKISLYTQDFDPLKRIAISDIQQLFSYEFESEFSLNQLSFAFLSRNIGAFIKEFHKAISNRVSPIFILRALQNYLQKLLVIKMEIRAKARVGVFISVSQAIYESRMPFFGRVKDEATYILKNIGLKKMHILLAYLLRLEKMLKSSDYNDSVIFQSYQMSKRSGLHLGDNGCGRDEGRDSNTVSDLGDFASFMMKDNPGVGLAEVCSMIGSYKEKIQYLLLLHAFLSIINED